MKKYRYIVFDKFTGEIYHDVKSFRGCDIGNALIHFEQEVKIYHDILHQHPYARFNIIPLSDENQQQVINFK